MVSFERGLAHGADILELDVHATSDGCIVVVHDPTLDRTTNGAGPVCAQSWEVVARLDAGFRFSLDGRTYPCRGTGVQIPSLEAVFQRFPDARFNIEVKQASPAIAARVVELVRRHGCADRVLLAAEDDAIMQDIRAAAGAAIATGFSALEVADFIGRLQSGHLDGYAPAGRALQIPVAFGDTELVTAASVHAAHALGLEVHVWTINDRAEMERLLDLGVDGIISDLPRVARAAVDARRR